jgi:small nuclear ribonucleoprotein (snRNP)-like protein
VFYDLFNSYIIIGVTGHRDIRIQDKYYLAQSIEEVLDSIICETNKNLLIVSALADGADRLIVKVAMKKKYLKRINIYILLPFDEDIYINTFGKGIFIKNSLEEFSLIKSSITEYFNLKEMITKFNNGQIYQSILKNFDRNEFLISSNYKKNQIIKKQYSILGEYLAFYSDILIALENSNTGKMKIGGTSECIYKRLSNQYKYLNGAIVTKNRLSYKIITPRMKDKNEIDEKFKIIKIN